MRVLHRPLVLLLFAFPLILPAQFKLPVAPSPAADAIPEANPARPTVTNPAHIPPPGYLQFEQGVTQTSSSPGLASQFSFTQTTKLSLSHYVMVQASTQPFARTVLAPGLVSTDTGDVVLGAQVLFNDELEGRSRTPTIALGYNRRMRAGSSPDLDLGSFSQGLVVLTSGTVSGIHYDSNFLFTEQTDGRVRRAQFGQTLALTRPLNSHLSLSAELWHLTQPLVFADRTGFASQRSNAVGILSNVAWNVRPNLVLDAGVDHGLTSTSTRWQGFIGFTYLLPQRLWQGGRR